MDPLTLFALASGAVQAVKKGCQLYKDIKSAAGDVRGVLQDLDEQFHKRYEGKPVPPEAVKQLNEEKARVKDLNKRSEENTSIYTEIGDCLGQYYDNYYKCLAVLEAEEKRSATEVYSGEDSLAKRALKRVLMQKQLEQMGKELRELMIYQSPPELGALFTDVEAMTRELSKQQKVLITKQLQLAAAKEKRRQARMARLRIEFAIGLGCIFVILVFAGMMMWLANDAEKRWGSIIKDKPYQTRLAEMKKQEWFERQKLLKDYQEFLEQRRLQQEPADESSR
jgi:hypothetical protein